MSEPARENQILTALPADPVPSVLPVCELPPLDVIPVEKISLLRRVWRAIGSFFEWIFGAVVMIVALAVLAAVPLLQFLSLGYMLEAGGRIARSGRLRDGFIGIRRAARAGSIVLGTWLMLLPLRFISSMALDAQLIDPDGPRARTWRGVLSVLTIVMVLHIVTACSRGGKLRHFLWPFTNPFWLMRRLWRGGYYTETRDAVWEFLTGMRLPYFFWLGMRGFAGALAWLIVPVTLLALGTRVPVIGFLIGLLGAGLLVLVLLYLPFLQMHFAVENRFGALFEFLAVRRQFRRAPWAFAIAFFITLLFAVPLYLLKIEMVPREAAWLPSLVFIVFTFPARLLAGWAYGRAGRRQTPRHWFFRWTGRLWMLPVAALYVLILFFTQYVTWEGALSLYQQHAFLLPVPFMGM